MEHNGFAKLIRIPQVHCCEAAERSNVPGRDATNYLKGSGLKSLFILRASSFSEQFLLFIKNDNKEKIAGSGDLSLSSTINCYEWSVCR